MFDFVMGYDGITEKHYGAFNRLHKAVLEADEPVVTVRTQLKSDHRSCNGTVIDVVGQDEMQAYWDDFDSGECKQVVIDPMPLLTAQN